VKIYYYAGCSAQLWLIPASAPGELMPRFIDVMTNEVVTMSEARLDLVPNPPEAILQRALAWKDVPVSARSVSAEMLFGRERRLPTIRRSRSMVVLSWIEVFFPKRVTREEIGDAIEVIESISADADCVHKKLKIGLKVTFTIVWVALHSIGHAIARLRGKQAR
jgi:hypothetical protein